MSFEGKVVVVTGGGSGIGRSVCQALADKKAIVAVVDRNPDGARETVALVGARAKALAITADVSDERQVTEMVRRVVGEWGRIDGLHNHAGILHAGDRSILEISAAAIDETLGVNVKGQMLVAKHVARVMLTSGSGAIVNTASDLSFIALPGVCGYVTSKAAILGLTRSMAVDLAPHGIRVNAVCPGFVYSNMTAALAENAAVMEGMKKEYLITRLGKPEDVASAVLYLLSEGAAFMTGSSLVVDGGHIVR